MSKLDAELLMNELLPFAEKMLSQFGEFHPFGGYLDNSRNVVHFGVATGGHNSGEKISIIVDSFKKLAQERQALAFGLVYDVAREFKDGSRGDAIKVVLEHRDGYCANVFFRYQLEEGSVTYLETIAQQGSPIFFD